jgi:DNA adenine methylase
MDFYYSPLRYPGGKGKVAEYFKALFKDNLLYDGIYVEPYAGGASVALSLLFNEYASRIIINDIDVSIYSFWYSVLNQTDELCKLITDTPVSLQEWDRQRDIQKRKSQFGALKVGFSTFYLNRTNRSGIINAGIIGGKKQTGTWKLDARFNKKDLVKRIQRIALYKDKIDLHNLDAIDLIRRIRGRLPSKSLFYFDPPYYVKGKDLYLNYYKHNDHEEIAKKIAGLSKHKWVVSYDNVNPICDLYSKFRQVKYSLNYSAASANKGEEVMIFSDNLYIANHSVIST